MSVSVSRGVTGVDATNLPYILAQSAVPVCLAPNGTVATNGIVTLGTALPATYSGGIWLRLPAGAVVGGSAGLYWAVMSSTTVGQVYTNFEDPASEFVPYVPGSVVAAVGSNSAYTQTTGAEITLANLTVPSGSMGLGGSVRLSRTIFAHNNSAGAKQMWVRFGSSQALNKSRTTTVMEAWGPMTISNRGVSNQQVAVSSSFTSDNSSSSAAGATYFTVETAADVAVTYTAQLAVATDYVVLECEAIEVLPS